VWKTLCAAAASGRTALIPICPQNPLDLAVNYILCLLNPEIPINIPLDVHIYNFIIAFD